MDPDNRKLTPDIRVLKRTPFVGRDEELTQLRELLDAAAGGHGGLAMIGGEPGVGKTRLAEEVVAEAREGGFFTVMGRCYDLEGGLPYQPFVEAIEEVGRLAPATQFREWLGDAGPYVARVAPELRPLFADLPLRAEVSPEEGRHLLFNACSDMLERSAYIRPILLMLDDVQWADASSLLLLQHIARRLAEMPVLVLCTYRDVELDIGGPLAKTLHELVRQRLARDVVVRALPLQGVAAMIETHGRGAPPPELVSLVYTETEGNPFFVEEVLRYLGEEGRLLDPDGAWARHFVLSDLYAPRTVRLVIEQRLVRLSEGCRHLLASAAVVGRDFSFELVGELSGLPQELLIDAAEEAERAALIHDASRGREAWYSFSHELVRQTLLGALSVPRRQRSHLEAAQAIERLHAADMDSHVAELAFHYRQAGEAADVEKAIHYSIRAGKAAAGVFAWAEAVRHYEGALQAWESSRLVDGDRRCQLLLSLGSALISAGDAERANDTIVPLAYALAESLGDADKVARAAQLAILGLSMQFAGMAMRRPDYQEWAGRLDRVAPEGTIRRIDADVTMAQLAADQFRFDETEARCLRAFSLAREIEAPESVMLSIFHVYALYCQGPRFDARRRQWASEVAVSLPKLPRTVPLASAELPMALMAGEALRWGDRGEASRVVDLMARFEAERPSETRIRYAPHFREILFRYMDGEVDTAASNSMRAVMTAFAGGAPMVVFVYAWNFGVWSRYYVGGTAADFAPTLESDERPLQSLRAVLLASFGRPEEARTILLRRRHTAPGAALGAPDTWPTPDLVLFTQAATLIGDAGLASWFAAPLWESEAVTTGETYTTMVNRHLGDAALLLGKPERALHCYERALAQATEMCFRPEVALARLALAELLGTKFPASRQSARDHLEFAIAEFDAMKMSRSLERALALQQRVSSHGKPRPAYPDGLSAREVEVVRLVAQGRTNQQIADELFISLNTVARHVSHIFDKTGAANRVDAASYALRHGLSD